MTALKESKNAAAANILDPSLKCDEKPSPLPEDTQKYVPFFQNVP